MAFNDMISEQCSVRLIRLQDNCYKKYHRNLEFCATATIQITYIYNSRLSNNDQSVTRSEVQNMVTMVTCISLDMRYVLQVVQLNLLAREALNSPITGGGRKKGLPYRNSKLGSVTQGRPRGGRSTYCPKIPSTFQSHSNSMSMYLKAPAQCP